MKLFVWHDVLYDYKAGIAFAFADGANEARHLLIARMQCRVREQHECFKRSPGSRADHVEIDKDLSEQLECTDFKRDLEKDPEVYEGQYADFLEGSS